MSGLLPYYAVLTSDGTLRETTDPDVYLGWLDEFGPEVVDRLVHDPLLSVAPDPGADFIDGLVRSAEAQ